jgi:hypothetical protein
MDDLPVDPEGFWNVLGRMPWHADTLLQVSEVFRHREGTLHMPTLFPH